jgi:hypothetical protein
MLWKELKRKEGRKVPEEVEKFQKDPTKDDLHDRVIPVLLGLIN